MDRHQSGPIKMVLLVIIGWLVGNTVFSETAQRIFLIFCINLGDYKSRKVTKPDFWKKFFISIFLRKGLQISIGWLVGGVIFSEMALRIFLIFCMKLGDNKGRKVTELDFWKKFWIWRFLEKGLQISIGWLVGWLVTQFSHFQKWL